MNVFAYVSYCSIVLTCTGVRVYTYLAVITSYSLQFTEHTSFSIVTLYLSLPCDDVTYHTPSLTCSTESIVISLLVKCLLCMSINLLLFFPLVSFISHSNALSLVIFINVLIQLSTLLLILPFMYMYFNT